MPRARGQPSPVLPTATTTISGTPPAPPPTAAPSTPGPSVSTHVPESHESFLEPVFSIVLHANVGDDAALGQGTCCARESSMSWAMARDVAGRWRVSRANSRTVVEEAKCMWWMVIMRARAMTCTWP